MKRFLTAAVFLGTSVALSGTLFAADPPVAAMPVTSVPAQATRLTVDQLGTMLSNLGYAPVAAKDQNGNVVGYNLSYSEGTWSIRSYVSISPDGTKVWFDTGIIDVSDTSHVPAQALLHLFADNNTLWPAYIYLQQPGLLRLAANIDNRDVTPATLRNLISTFDDDVKNVITMYQNDVKQVAAAPLATAPAPAPAPTPTPTPEMFGDGAPSAHPAN